MSLSTTQYGYIVDPMVPFTDDKGKTIKNGFIRVFMAGTSTPVLTYRNYDGATNQERIELDNSGRVKHNVIGSKGSLYKVVVYNILHSQENPLLTVDKIAVLGASINATGATIVTGLDSVTVQEENFLKATVEGAGVELALDPTEVTSEVTTTAAAETAAPDYVIPLLDKTGEGDGKKISLANLFKFALDWISKLVTTITSFVSGDFIVVSNDTNGARKMAASKLLELTAQNALAGNVSPAFDPTRDEDHKYIAGESVIYNGQKKIFLVNHYGAWTDSDAVDYMDVYNIGFGITELSLEKTLVSSPYTGKTARFKVVPGCRIKLAVSGANGSFLPTNDYYVLRIRTYSKTGDQVSEISGYYKNSTIPASIDINVPSNACFLDFFYRSSDWITASFEVANPQAITDENTADNFSTAATYVSGKFILHNSTLYQFISNHSAGSWNANHAKHVKVCDILEAIIANTTTDNIDYTSNQSNEWLSVPNVSIAKGQKFSITSTLSSGNATDIIWYANTTSDADKIANGTFGTTQNFVATQNITKIIGYVRGYSSAVISTVVGVESLRKVVFDAVDGISNNAAEITAIAHDVSASGVLRNTNWIYIENISIKTGQQFTLETTLNSGSATGVVWYANSAAGSSFGNSSIGTKKRFTATQDIAKIIGYVQGFSSASIDSELVVLSFETITDERLDALESQIVEFPAYAQTMVDGINAKLKDLQTSMSASLAFITDIHVAGATDSDNTQYAMKVSGLAVNKIDAKNPINLSVLNGDYLYNAVSQTKEASVAWYEGLSVLPIEIATDKFIGKGNHDVNDIAGTTGQELTDEELYQVFLKYQKGCVTDYGYAEKAYGYYDIPNRKIRCIFVNTTDVPYILNGSAIKYTQQHSTGVSNEQVNFIANALKFTESGWGVVLISHHALQNSLILNPNNSTEDYLNPSHGGTQLLGVLTAFRNKSSYSSVVSEGDFTYNIDVDFSDNASDEIIVNICGHVHADKSDTIDGILTISSMAASYVYTSYDSQGNPVSRAAKTSTETSWDVVTIDRGEKKIYCTRYGAGTDREFIYT